MLPNPNAYHAYCIQSCIYINCRLTRGIYHKIEKTCTKGQEKTTHDIKQKGEGNKARKQCMQGGYGVINR